MADNTLFEKRTAVFDGNIDLYYCGKRIKTKNHSYGPEIRSHFLIVLVEEGNATYYGPDGEIPFRKGDMLVMFPGEKIYYRADDEWSIKWIGVTGGKLYDIFASIGVTAKNPVFSPDNFERLLRITAEIYELKHDNSLFTGCNVKSLLYEFFSVLLSAAKKEKSIDYVKSAARIIEYNYSGNITVEDIAGILQLNSAYFSRLFKKETGLTPKKYIIKVRMNAAKKLLESSDSSVKEIAASVGFSDQLYFSRSFSEAFGLSPTEYRSNPKTKKRSPR